MGQRGVPRQGPHPDRRPTTRALAGNNRTLVLGVLGAVGGIAGSINAISDGAGVLHILALAGIGVLGLALAIAYVIAYSKRPR
ncbi:hypothetical protein ACFU99_10235 [Streptomyces sp. NPDC057654]|uniref:hypothetical protein n=1 Tax=Streptomyces sp. NPDC057654 TaxID=3346196 RepID=UPI0036BDFFC5